MELSSVSSASAFSPLPSSASAMAAPHALSAAQLEDGPPPPHGDALDEARDLVAHPVDAPHAEKHFSGAEIVRDVVIGMADGLTVPFALAAGLSALDSSAVVVTAGLAGTSACARAREREGARARAGEGGRGRERGREGGGEREGGWEGGRARGREGRREGEGGREGAKGREREGEGA